MSVRRSRAKREVNGTSGFGFKFFLRRHIFVLFVLFVSFVVKPSAKNSALLSAMRYAKVDPAIEHALFHNSK
jgi:hypothetical protein